eukprot:gene3531-6096_t
MSGGAAPAAGVVRADFPAILREAYAGLPAHEKVEGHRTQEHP